MLTKSNLRSEELSHELSDALEDVKTDNLTGLFNRVGYNICLDELKKHIGTVHDQSFAIVMMDINDLKYVNDNLGHNVGDTYILNCCDLIKKVFGNDIYRLGGDEFAAILTGDQYMHADEFYKQMLEYGKNSANYPINAENPSIAIGISHHKAGTEETIGSLVSSADESMYKNKAEIKAPRKDKESI